MVLSTTLARHSQLFLLRTIRKCSIQACLTSLEEKINSCASININKSISKLENIHPHWLHKQEGQKKLSSVLYSLSKKKYYKELHALVNYLELSNYDMWSGMSTIILNAYIDQKLWKDATLLFEAMKERDQIKHFRTYKRLITTLAQDNHLAISFKYFSEFFEAEFKLRTSRLDKPDFTILFDIMQSILQCETTEIDAGISRQYVSKIIDYIDRWGLLPPADLVELIGQWYNAQKDFKVTKTSFQGNQCQNCNEDLSPLLPFKSLCRSLVSNFQKEMTSSGRQMELKVLDDLFVKREPIDVIVDAANILFHGSLKNEKKINPTALKEVLLNLNKFTKKSFSRVAVVFPQSLSKPEKLQQFGFVDKIARQNMFNFNLNVVALRRTNDDIVMFYLTAKSELMSKHTHPVILSQDNFYNHRFILHSSEEQRLFFKWLRHRKKSYDGNAVLAHHNLQPIVRIKDGDLHIIDSKKNVMCIRQL